MLKVPLRDKLNYRARKAAVAHHSRLGYTRLWQNVLFDLFQRLYSQLPAFKCSFAVG